MILLDTHTLYWWLNHDNRLSKKALSLIENEQNKEAVRVSAISAWEIAMLVHKSRLALTIEVHDWIDYVKQVRGISFIPLSPEILVDAVTLPGDFHPDPADRVIVATARKLGAPLITADQKIHAYPHVETIW